jgi:peptidoglycan-N-acetylglucosamine deacetylase
MGTLAGVVAVVFGTKAMGRKRKYGNQMIVSSEPNYRPSAFIVVTLVLHIIAAGGFLLSTLSPNFVSFLQSWPYILAALIANHIVLTLAGLWPRSQLLGDNWVHLPPAAHAVAPGVGKGGCVPLSAVAITIDDGPDPDVTPRVLAILKTYQVHATFFCIAQRVAQHPELARSIVEQGHTIENHSYRHAHTFSLWGPRQLRADIEMAQAVIEHTVGRSPQFFRAPAGLRNPFLDYALQKNKVLLATWTRRGFDTRTDNADVVFSRLTRALTGGDIVLLHDSHCAYTTHGEPVICEVLPRLLMHIQSQGLHCVRLDEAKR